MQTADLIARIQALPKTHKVVTRWPDGTETRHESHSAAGANNYADHMRFRGAVSATVTEI
ncbi:MAG: hypothetical protein PS018_11530 [bacterium]|nr:hypothetical protein [bacterium]